MSLGKMYYDHKHTEGFSLVAKLVRAAKSNKGNIEQYLSSQDTYNLHKPVRKRFPRYPYTVTNIDRIWDMDLADLIFLSNYNDPYTYILNVIDIFSRHSWGVPQINRSGLNKFISK
jgi:hypothetical protein